MSRYQVMKMELLIWNVKHLSIQALILNILLRIWHLCQL